MKTMVIQTACWFFSLRVTNSEAKDTEYVYVYVSATYYHSRLIIAATLF